MKTNAKVVRVIVKERKIGENKWVYVSMKFSVADMGAKPGDELELIVMKREEWERLQAEITMSQEKLKQCQRLITSQLEMCHQIVQLSTLQLPSELPQPIQQRRTLRGRRPRQRPQQPQPRQQPRPQPQQLPPPTAPPIEQPTVPAELTEKLLKNEWVKILRTRH